jgi:AMMECR1 domain-containing protein
VAEETGWNIEEFWGHCSRDKAGLAWDAWKDGGVKKYTFTAEILRDGEEEAASTR